MSGTSINPSDPPPQPCDPPGTSSVEIALRDPGLVRTSLGLAVLIEICPMEADLTCMLFSLKGLPLFLAIKAVCLAIILAPLLRYFWLNGWKGAKAAKGKIIAVGTIVFLKLWLDVYCMAGVLFHS
jgi:cellulose synthase/poly-beta-1,6-N-acetylglucosamine synthase-like glycosyltransferase